jgi:hypothetical protein
MCFGLVCSASAEVPQQLHYNGYLTNAVGEAVDCPDPIQCDVLFDLTFRLYGSSEGGVAMWEELYAAMPIFGGSFHVVLGTVNPINPELLDGSTWLAVKVNENLEMNPRQKIVSAAYALKAGTSEQAALADNATQLGGLEAADYATQATLSQLQTELDPVATEGLPADLADGDNDTLGELVCGPDMLPKMTSLGWACGTDDAGELDTKLTEEEVDAMVANNGYALFTEVFSGSYTDLSDVPAGLNDGDDDSFAALTCADGQLLQRAGASWICVDAADSVAITEPAPCGPSTAGKIYYDIPGNTLRICDGTAYRKIKICNEVCPPPTTVGCGLDVLDDCGESCGVTGLGLNLAQCSGADTAPCGQTITDDCDNLCFNTGTAFNPSQCNPATTICGAPVVDVCGNDCGATGLDAAGCNDLDPCTVDACDLSTGCTHTFNLQCFGSGADGPLSVEGSVDVNSVKAPMEGAAEAGSNTISLTSADGFFPGDFVLIIGMGGSTAGNYEVNRIESIVGSNLLLSSPLTQAYCGGTSCAGSVSDKVQVLKLPQYSNVVVQAGGTIEPTAWNGQVGGVVAFMASDSVDVSTGGRISANGLGFRGGAPGVGQCQSGTQGESLPGPGAINTGNNGGGGGSGEGAGDTGNSGAGGGHQNPGAQGQNAAGNPTTTGGTSYGTADLSQIFMGSGGGGGGTDCETDGVASTSGGGGNGGGIIIIIAPSINPAGDSSAFTARANNASDADPGPNGGETGGGGGGAGGSILFITNDPSGLSGDVSGGQGTVGAADAIPYVNALGGTGSAGYVHGRNL